MDPLRIDRKRLESISSRLLEKGINLSLEKVHEVADLNKDVLKVSLNILRFHQILRLNKSFSLLYGSLLLI